MQHYTSGSRRYTAIYALNDIMGVKDDEEKVAGDLNAGYAVEASACAIRSRKSSLA